MFSVTISTLAQQAQPASPFSTLILIPIMLIIMYFVVIRPQKNEENRKKKMIESLKKGDAVITNSGMHGKVVEIKENNTLVVLNIGKDTNVTFNADAVLKTK